MFISMYIYIYVVNPANHMRLCCDLINTIFCMQLCLVRNRKHWNLKYFLLFALYSNCISYVLVLSLRTQKLKPDSALKILRLPYAYTGTYIHIHIHIHMHIHMHMHMHSFLHIHIHIHMHMIVKE